MCFLAFNAYRLLVAGARLVRRHPSDGCLCIREDCDLFPGRVSSQSRFQRKHDLKWTKNQPTLQCWWCRYQTQTREHLLKECPK